MINRALEKSKFGVILKKNEIGWKCLAYGEDGVITEWEGIRWDKRNFTRY